jgi:hypothetical protein
MRDGWRWLLVALGVAALGWALMRARAAQSSEDASIYADESERMQDA